MNEITSLSWARDVLPAVVRADFMDIPKRLALRGGGIGLITAPGSSRIVAVSDPVLIRQIFRLDERPGSYTDRGGMLYRHLRQLGPNSEPGDVLDGGLFTQPDHDTWTKIRQASVIGNVPQLSGSLLSYFAELLEYERASKKKKIDLLLLLKKAFIHTASLRLFGEGMQETGRARLATYAPEYFERMAWQLLFALLPGKRGLGRESYRRTGQALGSVLEEMISAARKDRTRFKGGLLYQLLDVFQASDPTQRQIIKGTLGTEIMASFDSVGVVVAKACHDLAKDHEMQLAAYSEVSHADIGRITPATLRHSLPLVGDIWKTSLHKYPAFRIIFRNVTYDHTVAIRRRGDERLYQLREGDQILLLIEAAHYDPAYWSQVDMTPRHTKEGWTESEEQAHFPFGMGERSCPGKSFANIAGLGLIATLLEYGEISLPCLRMPGSTLSMTSPLRSNVFQIKWR